MLIDSRVAEIQPHFKSFQLDIIIIDTSSF